MGDDLGLGVLLFVKLCKRIEFVGNCGMRMRAFSFVVGLKFICICGDIVVYVDVKMCFIFIIVVCFVFCVMVLWVYCMIDKMFKSLKYFGASDSLF